MAVLECPALKVMMYQERCAQLDKLISDAYELLSLSESVVLTSESPKQIMRLKRDIKETHNQIEIWQNELDQKCTGVKKAKVIEEFFNSKVRSIKLDSIDPAAEQEIHNY